MNNNNNNNNTTTYDVWRFSFRSTSTVEDILDKLEGWNRNDVQQIQLEHSKDHSLRKLLLHSENPVKLKEKVQSIKSVYILSVSVIIHTNCYCLLYNFNE